jgi:hypothetical protein
VCDTNTRCVRSFDELEQALRAAGDGDGLHRVFLLQPVRVPRPLQLAIRTGRTVELHGLCLGALILTLTQAPRVPAAARARASPSAPAARWSCTGCASVRLASLPRPNGDGKVAT